MKLKKILKLLGSVTGLIILDKIVGFIKQMIIASSFGADLSTDIVNLAQSFIVDMQSVFVQAIISAFVAVYISLKQKNNDSEKIFSFIGIRLLSFGCVIVFFVLEFLANPLSHILAPQYNNLSLELLAKYIRVYAFSMLLFPFFSVFRSILNSEKRFIIDNIISLIQSLVVISSVIIMSGVFGINILPISFITYSIINVVFLWFIVNKNITVSKDKVFEHDYGIEFLHLLWPLLISNSLIYINQLVDKSLVSRLEAGTVTSLIYGAIVGSLVNAFIYSFCSILFSYNTSYIAKGEEKKSCDTTVIFTSLLVILFMIIFMVSYFEAPAIIRIIYFRGNFDNMAVDRTVSSFRGYCFMFVPLCVRETTNGFHYAHGETKVSTINSGISILINVILSIILCSLFGSFGVAFATSVSVLICGILNILSSKKKWDIKYRRLYLYILGSFLASLCSVFVSKLFISYININNYIIKFVFIVILSLIIYSFFMIIPIKKLLDILKHDKDI